MATRAYLLQSILLLLASLGGFWVLMGLGYIFGGGLGGFMAVFLLPDALLLMGGYWVWLTRKRVRERELPWSYQFPAYAGVLGAAQGFVVFPPVIWGNVPVSSMSNAQAAYFVIDPFLPIGILIMSALFVAGTPFEAGRAYDKRLARGAVALTAYLIFSLAPQFAWPLRGL